MAENPMNRSDSPENQERTLDADATLDTDKSGSSTLPADVPSTIGPYRIVRRLGAGGMGEVFLAEQSDPIKRMVALKIIKPGMDSRQVVARFELERQTLAMMTHPGIARVFDAGQTEKGRPYFVMEHVEGIPINHYCDAKRLTTRQRLELIAEVCAGVQHAHQKAIIHRDLKPGNILVTEVDGKAVPKIIDFGVARATEQRDAEKTMFTQLGHVVGTPTYMSPEQTDPTNADIDTRTDIYSLGVVLYELLVGLKPFDTEAVHSAGYEAMLKFVREQEAPRPSLRLQEGGPETTVIAEMHQTEHGKLVRTLRGDLDWILLKALEKDRTRRYETANALAMDIRRYLTSQPVLASPPSAVYLTGKFVRRHSVGVTAAVATVVVLVAFALTMSLQNQVIARARDVAEIESAKSSAINNFLRDMLVSTDPWASGEHDLTVVQAMDAARADVDSIFVGQPLVAAEMHATMGETYLGLQKLTEAEEEVRKGLELQRVQLGADHPDLADSWLALSKIQRFNLELDEAIAAGQEVVRIRLEHYLPTSDEVLAGYDNLSELYITDRRLAEADSIHILMERIVANSTRDLRQQTASLLNLRSRVAGDRDQLVTADSLGLMSVEILQESNPDSPLLPIYLNNVAVNQMIMQDYDRAKATYGLSLELLARLFGQDHPEYAVVLENLGGIAFRQRDFEKCLANLEHVRDIRARNMGEDHPTVMRTMLNMATVANSMGNPERAVTIYSEVMPLLAAVNGEIHVDTATTLRNMGLALRDAGRISDAEEAIDRARPIYVELFGPRHHNLARLDSDLAYLRTMQKRWTEAEILLRGAVEVFEESVGRDDRRTQTSAAALVRVYEELGRVDDAAIYREYALQN